MTLVETVYASVAYEKDELLQSATDLMRLDPADEFNSPLIESEKARIFRIAHGLAASVADLRRALFPGEHIAAA